MYCYTCCSAHYLNRFYLVMSANWLRETTKYVQCSLSSFFCFTVNFWLERRTRSHSFHYYCCDRMSMCRPTVTIRPFAFFVSRYFSLGSLIAQIWTQIHRGKDLYVSATDCPNVSLSRESEEIIECWQIWSCGQQNTSVTIYWLLLSHTTSQSLAQTKLLDLTISWKHRQRVPIKSE